MTSPSLSWIDRAAFDRLVDRATGTSAPRWGALAPRVPAPKPAAKAASMVPPALVAKIASVVPPAPPFALAPYTPTGDGLEANLRELVRWIEENLRSRAAFIADDHGLPVVESARAKPGHTAATSSILLLLESIRSLMGDMGHWISLRTASGVLHFVEVETAWGRFGVGVLTEGTLTSDAQAALERAVSQAFSD